MMDSAKVKSPKLQNPLNHIAGGLNRAAKNIHFKMVEQICPDE